MKKNKYYSHQKNHPDSKMHTLEFYCVHILGMLCFIRKSSPGAIQPQEGARNMRRLHSLTADTFGGEFRETKSSNLLCVGALAGSEGNWQEIVL